MKLTIIPEDGAVYVDGSATLGLAITAPLGVHALQWSGASGWVEHSTGEPNQQITELPAWALDAVELRSSHLADLAAASATAAAQAAAAAAQAAYDAAHPTPAFIQASVVTATQLRLDTFAKTRNYDGILSACTYATSSVPRFAAEGQAAVDARDATWSTLYTLLGEVLASTRPMPSGFGDVEPLLPALEWPL